jgi:hypothetical protein
VEASVADDFQKSKELKEMVERLENLNLKVNQLKEMKALAIHNEDYDTAKKIKDEINSSIEAARNIDLWEREPEGMQGLKKHIDQREQELTAKNNMEE